MCGRAKLPDDVSEIKLDLKIDFDEIGDYHPRWNAAPTSKLPVVVSKTGTRILTLMRWGLIPSWAKDLKIGYSTFNARAETLATRAAFRGAWHARHRCLVLADGYYEWRDTDKQPFAVALANRGPMTLAEAVGLLAVASGRDDQILCHRHHNGRCPVGAPARSHADCHRAGQLGHLAWGKVGVGRHPRSPDAALPRQCHGVLGGRSTRRQCAKR